MAKAERKGIVTTTEKFVLELDKYEIAALLYILVRIGGKLNNTPRKYLNDILYALRDTQALEAMGCYTQKDEPSIYFLEDTLNYFNKEVDEE